MPEMLNPSKIQYPQTRKFYDPETSNPTGEGSVPLLSKRRATPAASDLDHPSLDGPPSVVFTKSDPGPGCWIH